mmetsp:Transcript_16351/g.28270  ORF Transcript_16351/g.28270 Transcript_16351/m.28270 type:complete len:882 (+) Transcript_16351:1154-3799(+)
MRSPATESSPLFPLAEGSAVGTDGASVVSYTENTYQATQGRGKMERTGYGWYQHFDEETDDEGSSPEIGRIRESHVLALAAAYVKAAVYDRRIDHETDPGSLWWVEFYYDNLLFRFIVNAALAGYFFITFFESRSGGQPVWLFITEAVCWIILALAFAVRVRFSGLKRMKLSKYAGVHIFAMSIALADLVTGWLLCAYGRPVYRYARIIRPILQLEYSAEVRRRVLDLLRTTWRVRSALLLLVFQITFFAVVGMFLFYGQQEGEENFSSMGQSLVTLIILLSTCNSPKVMVPAFRELKVSSLFFVVYLIMAVFLMLNLVLAVIYNEHRRHLKREAKRVAVRKRVCMSAAFRVLYRHVCRQGRIENATFSDEQSLPHSLVKALLIKLGLDRSHAEVFTNMLDNATLSTRGTVGRDEFEDILLIMHFTKKTREQALQEEELTGVSDRELVIDADTDAESDLWERQLTADSRTESFITQSAINNFDPDAGEESWPRCIAGCGRTRKTSAGGFRGFSIRVVLHHFWMGNEIGYVNTLDFVVNTLLIISGVATISILTIDMELIINGDPPVFGVFNTACSVFFMFEMAFRISAGGSLRFFEHAWNTFDFIIVIASFIGVVSQLSRLRFFNNNRHLILFVRKLRLLRLLRSVPQFKLLTELVVYVIPVLAHFAWVMLVFYYMFAIVGMGLFGHITLGKEYYQVNDFQTFAQSLLTLFELMVVNDWNVTMKGFYVATGNAWSQLYFIVWYFFAVIVCLNSVTSFALEALDVHISRVRLFEDVQSKRTGNTPGQSPTSIPPPLYPTPSPGVPALNENRELKRSMSYIQRFSTVEKVGKVTNTRIGAHGIMKMMQDIFNDEIDEPTTFEVDREFVRLGLATLTGSPSLRQ